ncbi:MAG: DUF4276 family protein [Euryarchaeota archaeon]|nr:DUF4276 family protein [Euryarchaeota archaeon]
MERHRGIIVEGPSDEKVIKEIATRLGIPIRVRVAKGKPELLKKMDSYALLLRECEKVIALIDSHCTEISKVEDEVTRARKNSQREIKICIVRHAIEAWFLADENALGEFVENPTAISNPEEICKPDEEIEKLFRNSGKEYLKTRDALKLINKINFTSVERKCESFKSFLKLLMDC